MPRPHWLLPIPLAFHGKPPYAMRSGHKPREGTRMEEPTGQLPKPQPLPLVLAVLLVVYVFNFLDRQIVNILAEPIRRDLGLSDTQIGLMTGIAFAAFFFCWSLTPSLLPRDWLFQGLIGGINSAIGYGVGTAIGWAVERYLLSGRRWWPLPEPVPSAIKVFVPVASIVAAIIIVSCSSGGVAVD